MRLQSSVSPALNGQIEALDLHKASGCPEECVGCAEVRNASYTGYFPPFPTSISILTMIHPAPAPLVMPWAVATGNLGTRLLGLSAFAYF